MNTGTYYDEYMCMFALKKNRQIRTCCKNIIEYMLLECSIGYTGINCQEQCPYPTYGEICQKICSCNRSLCDFSTGCKPNSKYYIL